MNVNEQIKASQVFLIRGAGMGLVKMALDEAMAEAEEQGLDIIEVSQMEGVPVVKIDNYSKLIYNKMKQEKENKKKNRENNQTKEVKLSSSIAEHDMRIKAKNIDRMLEDGNKVAISIVYKGREIRLVSEGVEKIENLKSMITSKFKVDKPSKIDGNKVTTMIIPSKN